MTCTRRPRSCPTAFTLIEIMIVVLIGVLITSLLLTGVLIAKKHANVIRVKSDLALIETALQGYKADFGDFPKFVDAATDTGSSQNPSPVTSNGLWLDYNNCRGAVLLCRALLSPGPAFTTTSSPPTAGDGADGPGFRARANTNTVTNQMSGKVYPAYLDSSKFKVSLITVDQVLNSNMQDYVLLDITGNPILYYPAATSVVTPNANSDATGTLGYNYPKVPFANVTSRFNGFDNERYLDCLAGGNTISSSSAFALLAANCGSLPFLLWTAGPDGLFGFGFDSTHQGAAKYQAPNTPALKSDNICNFDLAADRQK